MRFVARLAIAIATLIGSAIVCWGQLPHVDSAARLAQPPQLTPPQTVEGSWVSDQQLLAAPPEMFDAQELSGMPDYAAAADEYETGAYGFGQYENEPYEAEPYDGAECSDEGMGACGGPAGGYFGGFAARCHECRTMDLWDEVHAHRRCWVGVDYLSMWAKGNNLPPLVTTSPIGTPQDQAGVLPVSATTSILYGNGRVDLDQRNGARLNIGYWLVDGEFLGIEGQYFALDTQTSNFSVSSDFSGGDPNAIILARPYFDVLTDAQFRELIAFPDWSSLGEITDIDGSIDIRTVSNIQSANMTLRRLVWIDFTMQRRLDLLLGYRFFRLEDSVTVDTTRTIQPEGIIPLTQTSRQDQWRSINRFNGGEIGLKGQSYHGPLQLEVIAKCAFGNNRERTWINGFSSTSVDGGEPVTREGGLLTQRSNIGSYRRDVFTILPEADANIRFNVTPNLRLVLGYTFIYANRVQRSGDAIDLSLNPNQLDGGGEPPEPQAPTFSATDSTFWVHGYSGGIEYRW